MDFLEGFLIGPIWSDTEYESRQHKGTYVLLSLIMLVIFIFFVFKPALAERYIFINYPNSLIFLVVLVIFTPLISSFYYRLPLAIRPLIIILYIIKYILLFYLLVHFFLPLVPENMDDISTLILARMDDHISKTVQISDFAGSLFGMILGIVLGGLWIVGELLLLVIILLAIPILSLLIMRAIQYFLDYIYHKYIFQPLMRKR